MDIASWPWLNPIMRSGFLALCGLFALPALLLGQGAPAPVVVTEPVGVTAYVGETATLTTALDGTAPISVQWYKNAVAVSGATATTLTVTAVVEADKAQPTIVIPVQALQIDQQGAYVLSVDADKKIVVKRVTPGRQAQNGVAIDAGLSARDLVVVEGVQKVRHGQTVEATEITPEG